MADRVIVQPYAIPQDTDLLNTNRFAMTGLGMALLAVLGSGTYVDGLACTPVGGNMQMQVGPGAIYTLAAIDATAYGSLAADTADQIVQQGLTFGQTAFTLAAPATAGQSIVYLIEAQYQQVDADPVALQYYDSVTKQAYTGTATDTVRKGVCALQAKAGTAAATGSQVAPTADAGWVPLWTVTVANGQAAIVAGNIASAAGAPFIAAKLGTLMQMHAGNPNGTLAGTAATAIAAPSFVWDYTNSLLWVCTTTGSTSTAVWNAIGGSGGARPPYWCGTSTGSANAQTVTPPSAMQSFAAGDGAVFTAGFTNTGALTVTVGSFGTFSVRKDTPTSPAALTGGEVVAGNIINARLDGTYLQLVSTDLGTASMANASSATGTVAAVSGAGSITPGHLLVAADANGTAQDGGPMPSSSAPTVVSTSQAVTPGTYYVDTSGGAISLTLTSSLSGGYTFIDAQNTWGANNLTINGNGHNIGDQSGNTAATFLADVSDYQFSIEASGTYWRLV